MLDKVAQTPRRDVVERFVSLLTGAPDNTVKWRFLPESPETKNEVRAAEASEREQRKNAGERTWRQFALRRNYQGSPDEVWEELLSKQRAGWGVFAVVNEGGHTARCIQRVRALFIDQDNSPLDGTEWHRKPDFVCQRSETRWHAYWLVEDCPVGDFSEAQRRLALHYKSDPSICDPARVMRVPGTVHHKCLNGEMAVGVELLVLRDEWEPRHRLKDLLEGLPEVATREAIAADTATGEPVSADSLRRVLGYQNPASSYSDWRDTIAAIRATPLAGDQGEELRREIAHAYSQGQLDHLKRFERSVPSNYDGPEPVDVVFDSMPPRPGGVGFGTLVYRAKQAGMPWGEPEPVHRSAAEVFNAPAERSNTSERFAAFEPWQFRDRPAPKWLVDQLVREKAVHINFGKSESAKTFFALDLLGSVAAGIPAFGKFEVFSPGDVVFFCDEDPDDVMKVRWPAWCRARGIADPYGRPFPGPGRFVVVPRCPLVSDPAEIENAIKLIHELKLKPKLVAIDTAAKAMGGMDQDSARDVGIFVAAMSRLRREFGCAGWITHHPKKSDPGDMRGSGALTNDVDIVWQSVRGGQTLAVKMQCTKMKGAPKPEPLHFMGKLCPVGEVDQNGNELTAPVFTHVSAPVTPELSRSPALKPEQQALKSQVLESIRAGDKLGALPLNVRQIAEHINPRPSGESMEDWERRVSSDMRKLQRHVSGTAGRHGCLSDLVELDSRGGPIMPFRFILPDQYQTDKVTSAND